VVGVPTSVRVAVWSFRLAAVYAVGSAVLFLLWVRGTVGDVDRAVSAVDAVADLGLDGQAAEVVQRILDVASDDRWSTVLTVLAVLFLVGALACAVVYEVLARSLLRGRRGTRAVATALGVVSLLWLVLGPQAWLWVALGGVGVVAAWRPSATAYAAQVRGLRTVVR
jgi:hypothetical protein